MDMAENTWQNNVWQKNTLHLKAPGNWINDPNGFIYYKGKYHLFYQHFPYAPRWGTMHWGHAVSVDLVHWEHLGIALFPTKEYDKNGIFSGSALEMDGRMYLYYSAVRYLETDAENIHVALQDRYETSQALIVSEDGFHFDNWGRKRQILPVIRDENIANAIHTRDPKVWYEDGWYYMALGSTFEERAGRVLFFRSRDAQEWEYAAQCRDERLGRIVECPDLFRLGETDVFMASLMYVGETGKGYEHLTVCGVAEFDRQTCKLTLPGALRYVDYGMDLYAPQTNLDKDGRRVMIGWMRMPRAVEEEDGTLWNGMMCLPRVVEVENGHVFFRVHPEVERYFSREVYDTGELPEHGPCRIQTMLAEGERLDIGGYLIRREQGCVKADRSRVFGDIEGIAATGSAPCAGEGCLLDIFVEPNLIEIFINGGEAVISHVVYGLGRHIAGNVEHIWCAGHCD